jgi:hypothetical protein
MDGKEESQMNRKERAKAAFLSIVSVLLAPLAACALERPIVADIAIAITIEPFLASQESMAKFILPDTQEVRVRISQEGTTLAERSIILEDDGLGGKRGEAVFDAIPIGTPLEIEATIVESSIVIARAIATISPSGSSTPLVLRPMPTGDHPRLSVLTAGTSDSAYLIIPEGESRLYRIPLGADFVGFETRFSWYSSMGSVEAQVRGPSGAKLDATNGAEYIAFTPATAGDHYVILHSASGTNGVENRLLGLRALYFGNGNTEGTAPSSTTSYQSGNNATVAANTGFLARPDSDAVGWSQFPDGSGTVWRSGDSATIPSGQHLRLYARYPGAWIRSYGGAVDYSGVDVAIDDSGAIYAAGGQAGPLWIGRLDGSHQFSWIRTMAISSSNLVRDLVPAPAGEAGFFLAGYTEAPRYGYVARIGEDGNVLWQRRIGHNITNGDRSFSITNPEGTSELYVVGHSQAYLLGNGATDITFTRLQGSNGNISLFAHYGRNLAGTGFEVNGVAAAGGSAWIACEEIINSLTNRQALLLKVNPTNGLLQSVRSLGGPTTDVNRPLYLGRTLDGALLTCVAKSANYTGPYTLYVMKLDPANGDLVWCSAIGATNGCTLGGIVQMPNGDVVVSGTYDPGSGSRGFFRKLDSAGNHLGSRSGFPGIGLNAKTTIDGDVLCVGTDTRATPRAVIGRFDYAFLFSEFGQVLSTTVLTHANPAYPIGGDPNVSDMIARGSDSYQDPSPPSTVPMAVTVTTEMIPQ